MAKLYGRDGTIHQTTDLSVEVDGAGNVVAVWFRCMQLPFTQSKVDEQRAADLRSGTPSVKLVAVEYEDK